MKDIKCTPETGEPGPLSDQVPGCTCSAEWIEKNTPPEGSSCWCCGAEAEWRSPFGSGVIWCMPCKYGGWGEPAPGHDRCRCGGWVCPEGHLTYSQPDWHPGDAWACAECAGRVS